MKKPPLISIILLNYNNMDYTIPCIESLEKTEYPSYEIIVIDNGSEKNEAEIIQKKFPKVRVIASKKNNWFAEGNNLGVRHAKGEYIFLLNNDTLVDKKWLSGVIDLFKDPSVGIVQSRMFAKFSKEEYIYDNNNMQSIIGTPLLNKLDYDENGLKDSFFAVGCSLIYPKKLFGEPFDKDYLIYAEDTALSFRARLEGYKIKEFKNSIIYHEGTVTMKKMSDKSVWLKERNYLMNLLIFYQYKTLSKLSIPILLALLMRNLHQPNKIHIRLSSYFWLLMNLKNIHKKRKKMQSLRKVNDSEILKMMSYKFIDPESVPKIAKLFIKSINKLTYLYCKLLNVKTSSIY